MVWLFFEKLVFHGPIAQSVEQLPFKQMVAGSIPAWPTKDNSQAISAVININYVGC